MKRIKHAFDGDALKRACVLPESHFASAYDMETVFVNELPPDNFYHYRDNDSAVLAVAHLDTVADAKSRRARIVNTAAGPVVHSRALDDRLGAYTILEWLPALGITCDWLLTTGEESGRSTAGQFVTAKEYNWIVSFDRGGTDIVAYQYEDYDLRCRVKDIGGTLGEGSFSDICWLEHLGVKALNWGIGYRDYHGPRAHAYLADTFRMVNLFTRFWDANADEVLPHEQELRGSGLYGRSWWSSLNDADDALSDDDLYAEWSRMTETEWRAAMEADITGEAAQ